MITNSNVAFNSQTPQPQAPLKVDKTILTCCERWARIVDNSRYLAVEYRYKEKEYGIKWRTSFELRFEDEFKLFVEEFGNPNEKNDD